MRTPWLRWVILAVACSAATGCRVLHAPKATTMNDEILAKLDATGPVELAPETTAAPKNERVTVAASSAETTHHCAICEQHASAAHSAPVTAAAPIAPPPAPIAAPAPQPAVRTTPAPAPAPTTNRVHTVRKGETLQKISRKYYGTTRRWMALYEANKDTLKDPDHLQVGMKLRIP